MKLILNYVVLIAMRLCLFFAIVLLLPESLVGQQVLSGIITDSLRARPLEAVEVTLFPSGLQVLSDVDGSYRLRVGAGTTTIRFRRPGYRAEVRSISGTGLLSLAMVQVPTELAGLTVLGEGAGALARLPGSGAIIGAEVLRATQPLSASELLRGVAGVNVQDEEGLGLRANVGIRGLNPDRSRSVLVLEDGVPVALNPYSEPEMYYSPPIDRMSRIELVKGSGSILHGPQTIGGVINYVTADPTSSRGSRWNAVGGAGGYGKAQYSATGAFGGVALLGVATHRRVADLRGLRLRQTDLLLKGAFALTSRDAIGFKFSAYSERSNATYVGLTDSLYRADRLAYPGVDDALDVGRLALTLSHQREDVGGGSLRTVAYAYTTSRNWGRQNYSYNSTGNSLVFANASGNRNRSFEVAGIESRYRVRAPFGEFEGGVRAHVEGASDRHVDGATATSRSGALRDSERREGAALALFGQYQVSVSPRLRVSPGLRLEHMTFERRILRMRVRRTTPTGSTFLPEDVDLVNTDALTVVIPGLGLSWYGGDRVTLFAGAHRGFAPPRTKDAFVVSSTAVASDAPVNDPVALQLDAEKSWNVEFGARTRPVEGVTFESTLFLLDFTNQIITPSLSGGSVSQAVLANQGATRHRGIELAATVDWQARSGFPLRTGAQYTYVDAVFSRDRFLAQGSDTVNVRGNRLPYAPRHLLALHAELGPRDGPHLRVDGTLVGPQYSDNFETETGTANGRIGAIPAHSIWNVGATLPLVRHRVVLVAAVKNLLDANYIASRRPEGIKPGLPRTLQLGIEWNR